LGLYSKNHFSVGSAGEAEAVKQWCENMYVKFPLFPASEGEAEAIKQISEEYSPNHVFGDMPTWYWHTEQIEEVLSIPIKDLEGKSLILPESIDAGFHLFRKVNEGRVGDRLSSLDGRFPFAIIITHQGKVFEISPKRVEENFPPNAMGRTVSEYVDTDNIRISLEKVETSHPWFLIAAKMTAFLKQKLVDVQSVKALKRPDRKRMGMDSPASRTEVNVITWRKVKYQSDAGKSEWDKHWWVRMHYRKQWYPSKNAHQLICIDPFVKGNTNMPLHMPKPTVNKVGR